MAAADRTTFFRSNRPRLRGMIAWLTACLRRSCFHGLAHESGRSTACRWPRSPRRVGTPCYVYSAADDPRRPTRALDAAFGDYPHAIHYALKANSTLEIVRLLKELGSSVDANSMGEVDVALRCGFQPGQIMFTGVGKSADELVARDRARPQGHQRRIAGRARSARSPRAGAADRGARRAARQSGHRRAQPSAHLDRPQDQQVRRADRCARRRSSARFAGAPGSKPVGVHSHIGSQITTLDPLLRAAPGGGRSGARRSCRTACRCGMSTSAAASASPTTARRRSIRPNTRARWSTSCGPRV